MSKTTIELLKNPVILALRTGDIIKEMNLRITDPNGIPIHKDIHPTVHCRKHNRMGKEFMSSFDGVIIDQETALQLLGLTSEEGVSGEDVKAVKANPKKYSYAYVRVPGKKNDVGFRPTFGSLYCVPDGQEDIDSWTDPRTGTDG